MASEHAAAATHRKATVSRAAVFMGTNYPARAPVSRVREHPRRAPKSLRLSRIYREKMFQRISIVGRGRVGSAIAARLRQRGVDVDSDRPDLVLLCVPDAAIREVAAGIEIAI